MPFPVWSRTSASSGGSNPTTQSIILPTFVAGDLFVLYAAAASAGSTYETLPTGFTTLFNGGPSIGTAIVYRVMETGDNRTASFGQTSGVRQAIIAYKFNSGSYVGVPEMSTTPFTISNIANASPTLQANPPVASSSWGLTQNVDTFWGTFLSRGGNTVIALPDGISDVQRDFTPGSLLFQTIGHFYNRESNIDPTAFIFAAGSTSPVIAGTFAVQGTPFTGSYALMNITGSGRSVMSFSLNGNGRVTVK